MLTGLLDPIMSLYRKNTKVPVSSWYDVGSGWKANDITGRLAKSDEITENFWGGLSPKEYTAAYAGAKDLDPYKNKHTGWLWNGDAYYWPTGSDSGVGLMRHLRPGETNKKKHAGVFSAIGTAIGTYLCPGIGTAIGAWMGSALDGVNDPKQLATSSAIAGATAYVGSQLDLGSLFGLSGSTTPSGMNPYNSYIMGGNNAAAGNLAYGNASNLGTFTGSTGNYFAAAPELGLMSSSMAPLSSYTAGGGSLPTVTGDSLKTYTGNTTGEYFTPKTDFSPTITDRLLDAAVKTGSKQLIKTLANSLLSNPTAAATSYGMLSAYTAPKYQTTGNTWDIPEPLQEVAATRAVQQIAENKAKAKKEEENQFQPWLEKWREPYKEYIKLLQTGDIKEDFTKPKQFLSDYV